MAVVVLEKGVRIIFSPIGSTDGYLFSIVFILQLPASLLVDTDSSHINSGASTWVVPMDAGWIMAWELHDLGY